MKSGELAKLAGVTPRTLRHYREVGLLLEPERDSNGYCEYRMQDLIRVLRVKNLASLGFSLSKIGTLIESLDDTNDEVTTSFLDDLDKELLERIEQLEKQRQTIALLKGEKIAADISPAHARYMSLCVEAGYSPEHLRGERDALLLAMHLLSDAENEEIHAILEENYHDGLPTKVYELNMHFDALAADASEKEKQALFQECFEYLITILDDVTVETNAESPVAGSIFKTYLNETYNAAQVEVIARLEEAITKHLLLRSSVEESYPQAV